MSVGALITWSYKAGGRLRRGSPKAGTTVEVIPLNTNDWLYLSMNSQITESNHLVVRKYNVSVSAARVMLVVNAVCFLVDHM